MLLLERIKFGKMRRSASLNNLVDDSSMSALTSGNFDWGDLQDIKQENNRFRRRSIFHFGCQTEKKRNETDAVNHLTILDKDWGEDCQQFPRSSLRYLPILLRDAYAMCQTIRPASMGNAELAQIDLRLRLRRPRKLPYHRDVYGTVVILDLSGFTALGERLRSELGPREGAAEFAHRVNAILSSMVKQVYRYKGDVLMFAGDALICIFSDEPDRGIDRLHTLNNARNCCLNVLGEVATTSCGEFTVHGGASHGLVRCFFLGRPTTKPGECAFVVSGAPLRRAGILLDASGKGQIFIEGLGKDGIITEDEGRKAFCHTEDEKKSNTDTIPLCVTFDNNPNPVTENTSSSVMDHTSSNTIISGTGTATGTVVPFGLIDNYEVHPFARAYISKLQARRGDIDSQNALSILNNELRRVAIVFVGLRDLDDVDDSIQKSIDLMNNCFISLSNITHNCNGAVRDMLVDDKGCVFIAVFGAHSHEVNPCFDATVCAMRMQAAILALNMEKFSLGVSYGDCFCGEVGPSIRSDFVVMGPEVNMAARLMGKAPNHGTLVSKRIYSNCNKDIHFTKTSKEIKVKGKNDSFHAYIPQSRRRRTNTVTRKIPKGEQRFILMPSRKIIFDKIYNAMQASNNGTPQIVFNVSAPFLGKSRLIEEISKKAMELGFAKSQSFRTSLDSYTSYFPFRQITSLLLQECASRITNQEINDDNKAMTELIDHKILNRTDRVVIGSILPSVIDAQLMSLLKGQNPTSLAKTLVESMLKILIPLQPLMMVFEGDGQLDPSSWSLLSELMKEAKKQCPKLFILIVFQDSPPIPVAASNLRSEALQVDLLPFDETETEIFVKWYLGISEKEIKIDEKLLEVVYDRSNGCPSFLEYILKWALDKQMFEYTEGGKRLSLKKIDEHSDSEDVTTAIPRELSNIVLAPFNDLSPVLWDALKIASCIGYSFDAAVYGELTALNLIPRIELLTKKYDAFECCSGTRYKWKHQAVFESVKSLLMTQQRIQLHRVIVGAFEERRAFFANSPDLCDEVHRILARHCSLAEMWENAFTQYVHAGMYAERTYKFSEAVKMYEEAISGQSNLAHRSPSSHQLLMPKIRRGSCLKELARYNEAETILTQCLVEAEKDTELGGGDEMMLIEALTALAALHQAQSHYNEARELYKRALPLSRQMQSSPSSLWLAGIIAGYAETLRKSGDLPLAEKMHREALEIRNRVAEESSCTDLELAISYTQLGCTLYGMKQYDEAYGQHRLALFSRYKYLDFSHGLMSESLNYCAESLCALGKPENGIPLAMHAVEIRKLVFGESHPALAHALSVLASCYHKVGRSRDALIYLEKCLQICEAAFHKNHANNIPNLINYAKVLRVTGKCKKALKVYDRAIKIHLLNFKEGQNANQLDNLQLEYNSLKHFLGISEGPKRRGSSSSVQSLPSILDIPDIVVEGTGTPIIISTDIGRDIDDELSIVLLASLKRMCLLNPIAIVTTLAPQGERANLLRGSLDALGMVNIPVGIGSSGGVAKGEKLEYYGGEYARKSCATFENGVQLMKRALKAAPKKSVQFLCIASLTDTASLIQKYEELFFDKVKEVVVMGGVEDFESSEFLQPDTAYNNNCDMPAARFVYKRCQELGIPTITVSRWAAYGSSVSTNLLDELARTEHMVACNIRNVSEASLMKLWKKVNFPLDDPRREKLPERCDREWFCRTFTSKYAMSDDESIWSQVTKVNLYDPLALLACVPAFRELHFAWKTKVINNTPHIVTGISNEDRGIIDASALYDEFFSLLRLSLTAALEMI